MPAIDRYHDAVKRALVKDGWTIEEEQVKLKIGKRRLWVDLQARHIREDRTILVEIKGFETSASSVNELEDAIGQYVIYQATLVAKGLRTPLCLAIPTAAFMGIFSEDLGKAVTKMLDVKFIVFEPLNEEVVTWTL